MRKKKTKTQKALDLVAKLRKAGPPPEFPEFALNKDRIVGEKQENALKVWAFQKMGADIKKYHDQANRNFLTLVYMAVTIQGQDLTTALKQTPYSFPLKLAQRQSVPFDISTFIKIKEEYDRLLPAVQVIKRKTRHQRTAQKVSLAEKLKITDPTIMERYLEMNASDIVLDHLRSKHRLTVDIEAIQKHLSLVRNPMKMSRRIIETIAKESGIKPKK